ncbi:MAG: leucine--tRNA ligase [Acidobacteriota bacterium]|jgi:leucyl-tRNA synthetase|nr:leucine--tRNA ligase [Acidobacteriota bacterium]
MPVYDPQAIEAKWQKFWEDNKTFRAEESSGKPKLYVLDMFPYPSGEGLHVGHPEGYSATDMFCRYKRMRGFNVLHPMGYDAFGLPAEQYAINTGTHPRVTTEKNIANIRRQIKRLGFSYDWDREFATTDTEYVHWTQWIFLLLFDTWFDPDFEWTDTAGKARKGKGRPIAELPVPAEVAARGERAAALYRDAHRLAYQAESPVNWCAALGTVLADEEVIGGRSERGDHPVERVMLRQWMLRITKYADRLVEDLDTLDWPDAVKEMQRNWVGRSTGAEVDFYVGAPGGAGSFEAWKAARARTGFPDEPGEDALRVYTTRPDTLFGATYMVLAPEHPWVDRLATEENRAAVDDYRRRAAATSEEDRVAGRGEKSGVFTGGYAVNPVDGGRVPVWIADYVLASYGTGAIMAVPGHDQRDFEFARKFNLPIRAVVAPTPDWLQRIGDKFGGEFAALTPEGYERRVADIPEVFAEEGTSINSGNAEVTLTGMATADAKAAIIAELGRGGIGRASVKYKLRDWLFSRQRYWGEPIPILHELDGEGQPTGAIQAVPEGDLPLLLPELEDFKPTGKPGGPLEKAAAWLGVERDGRRFRRETNTMPQWAGSCWYYLRFCDPRNGTRFCDPEKERHWMPVDLYVGGAEHAVLHLLYSRFWHKVLFDRGHVSTMEPFQKLVNQGMILSVTYRDAAGRIVPYKSIRFEEGKALDAETGEELKGETEKMSKSRGNVIPVDVPIQKYGSDTTRLYEMFMGPLETVKPWSMQGTEGVSRFLNRAWRMIIDEDAESLRLNPKVSDAPAGEGQLRVLHKTIQAVTQGMESLSFNTAVSRLMEFVNFFTAEASRPRAAMEGFVLMLAPMAPHICEELWEALGHEESLAYAPWPEFDERHVRESAVELPVQVNGKVRGRVTVAAGAGREESERAALGDANVQRHLAGLEVKKVVVVPGKLVSIVAK